MIKIQGNISRQAYVACSGGVDSMAVIDFLSRKHDVTAVFFHHGTETSEDAYEFLTEQFSNTNVDLRVGKIVREKNKNESQEEYWRNERYDFFRTFDEDIITCHHLDDCVETWVWSSMHGEGKIIPYRNGNVIRPFRENRKQEFVNWCVRNNVKWIEDKSNEDTKYMRNFIRKDVMPKIEVINPGIYKVIKKKVIGENTE